MDALITLCGDIPLSTVILTIVAIVFLIKIGKKVYKDIADFHDKRQERYAILSSIQEELIMIKKNQEKISKEMNELALGQEEIKEKQKVLEENHQDYILTTSRDRLLQSYRYYTSTEKNPMGAWSEMEKEAFDKLFKTYERMGGDGLLHTEVEPAMAKLDVISLEDVEGITALMSSRKG